MAAIPPHLTLSSLDGQLSPASPVFSPSLTTSGVLSPEIRTVSPISLCAAAALVSSSTFPISSDHSLPPFPFSRVTHGLSFVMDPKEEEHCRTVGGKWDLRATLYSQWMPGLDGELQLKPNNWIQVVNANIEHCIKAHKRGEVIRNIFEGTFYEMVWTSLHNSLTIKGTFTDSHKSKMGPCAPFRDDSYADPLSRYWQILTPAADCWQIAIMIHRAFIETSLRRFGPVSLDYPCSREGLKTFLVPYYSQWKEAHGNLIPKDILPAIEQLISMLLISPDLISTPPAKELISKIQSYDHPIKEKVLILINFTLRNISLYKLVCDIFESIGKENLRYVMDAKLNWKATPPTAESVAYFHEFCKSSVAIPAEEIYARLNLIIDTDHLKALLTDAEPIERKA